MNRIAVLALFVATSFTRCASAIDVAPLKVLRYGVVNDTVTDAVTTGGLVRTGSGDFIATFVDRGDSAAGAKCYFVRSKDEGRTWSEPYLVLAPENSKQGLFTELFKLPDGDVLLVIIRIAHQDSTPESVFRHRESTVELKRSRDNGETFEPMAFLDTPPGSLTSTVGDLYQLTNGDLILPAYTYTGHPRQHPGYEYGAGFYRSTDGGQHWGPLEVVFNDPPSVEETTQRFNEAAFAVRDDGVIIAYARVDVHRGDEYKMNRMWRCQSKDQGVSWTQPVETDIAGIYPVIGKTESGQFVMACGVRDSKVMRRLTSVFTSDDGVNWDYRGYPYYARTNGRPYNSATGGSQSIISMGNDQVYIVFYSCDPTLPGTNKTYINGCLIQL